jgi:hypothetical protein
MPSSEYLRRQAELCLQLAMTLRDEKAVAALAAMADDFIDKAEEIEQTAAAPPRSVMNSRRFIQ